MWKRLLALTALYLALGGCVLELISGPSTVESGAIVEYTVRLEGESCCLTLFTVGVQAVVPESWELVGAAYTGVFNGADVQGEDAVLADRACGDEPAAGYKVIAVEDDFGSSATRGSGTYGFGVLRFSVEGPPANHELSFTGYHRNSETGVGDTCSDPVSIAVQQLAPQLFFADGFESGSTDQWTTP